jgi:hypothetical protein
VAENLIEQQREHQEQEHDEERHQIKKQIFCAN